MFFYLFTCLLFVPAVLNAEAIYEMCSRQGAPGPIYHCPLGTHCTRNHVLIIGNEETEFLSIKKGKQFTIELPIKPMAELWTSEPLPKESIIETLYQAPAKNDPTLFIFTFLTKKAGTIDLKLRKIASPMQQPAIQKVQKLPERPPRILKVKTIAIKIIP